jgi:hypothetical protein
MEARGAAHDPAVRAVVLGTERKTSFALSKLRFDVSGIADRCLPCGNDRHEGRRRSKAAPVVRACGD